MTDIFSPVTPDTNSANALANGFLAEVNKGAAKAISEVDDRIKRFWFRNQKADGTPSDRDWEKMSVILDLFNLLP